MPKTKAVINIQNVVAAATLKQRVDLNAVVKSYPGVEYRPEQFPGLVFRLKRPKTATLIFNSGKMVCTGAKSEKEARRAVMTVVKELKKGGIIIISKPDLKVGMKRVSLKAEMLEIPKSRIVYTRYGTTACVSNALIRDETGSMKMSLWNQQIDMVHKGDVVDVKNGEVAWFSGERQLRLGRSGSLSVIECAQKL